MNGRHLAAAGIIVGAALAAYHSSFSVPFVFDDIPSILENPTLRHLWPIGPVLSPPFENGLTVGGRPVVNLSLAVNYAFGGMNPWGYHALNLAIHILAGLTLFGIVRRTLAARQPSGSATLPAFAAALLWTVHPLQTESVTYVVQRAESAMGLFYLLTLYSFIRGTQRAQRIENRHRGSGWFALSVVACLLGMATKEVMVSAPLIVFLYDRTFVANSFGAAWRERRRFYLALAGTWLVLGWLVVSTHGRGGSAGFGLDLSWTDYVMTQLPAIMRYLGLSVWPHPLTIDYGAQWTHSAPVLAACGLTVAALAAGTIVALRHRPALGFLGAWFFAILAPTSLVPGARQTMAEHRMYLALAPVAVLAAVGIDRWAGRLPAPARLAGFLALAAFLGLGVSWRNEDYRSNLVLWTDAAAKTPTNPFAHNGLGVALAEAGRFKEAIAEYERALRLKPAYPDGHFNLGVALQQGGRTTEAIAHLEEALRLRPEYPQAHSNLGNALFSLGRVPEAIAHYQEALRLQPDLPQAHNNLGLALAKAGQWPEAIAQDEEAIASYRRATGSKAEQAESECNLGNALSDSGRSAAAITHYEAALRLQPHDADAHYNLGNALTQNGQAGAALVHYQEALRLRPDQAEAHANFGAALGALGRMPEAIAQFEQALHLKPDDTAVRYNLALALRAEGRTEEAASQFKAAERPGPP